MIKLFTYRLGRTLKVPLLAPLDRKYCARVEAVGELVDSVVENWESFRSLVARLPEELRDEMEKEYLEPELDRPQHVAYMVRKLAEMLSGEEIETLGRQLFLREARNLSMEAFSDSSCIGMDTWRKAERAMKMVYDGFSAIQGRLDLGLNPFPEEYAMADGISLAEETIETSLRNHLIHC